MNHSDVVIIGGGVMGLLTARELSVQGASVTLIDKGSFAGEASWAGGGIVSPLYPWRYDPAITALASQSQRDYLALAPVLEQETGVSPELRRKGLLMLEVEDQAQALDWARESGASLSEVDADFVAQTEPLVAAAAGPCLWMPEVCSVRNPRLGQALSRSLAQRENVTLVSGCAVTAIQQDNDRVVSVDAGAEQYSAECFLVCAGAWSGGVLSDIGVHMPVVPVKGQMMLFNTPGNLLERVVLKNGRYLIPRNDGRILVGSTLEYSDFDKRTTESAYQSLYQSALDILPALARYPVEAHWAGLRPGSPSGIPFIGAVPGYSNLFVNAGHFRNGLVLAPASCRLAADLIGGRTPVLDPAPYAFSAERASELR